MRLPLNGAVGYLQARSACNKASYTLFACCLTFLASLPELTIDLTRFFYIILFCLSIKTAFLTFFFIFERFLFSGLPNFNFFISSKATKVLDKKSIAYG